MAKWAAAAALARMKRPSWSCTVRAIGRWSTICSSKPAGAARARARSSSACGQAVMMEDCSELAIRPDTKLWTWSANERLGGVAEADRGDGCSNAPLVALFSRRVDVLRLQRGIRAALRQSWLEVRRRRQLRRRALRAPGERCPEAKHPRPDQDQSLSVRGARRSGVGLYGAARAQAGVPRP